ncbi:MAG: hypothetical protein HJJLKODD_02379 [Phycisphaerae bacterium]|nr:hypothetical protein [Phycisphaerae bacterium]
MKYAIELNREQSEQIMQQAKSTQAQVSVQPKHWPASRWLDAQLLNCTPEHLELQLPPIDQIDPLQLLNIYCQVDLQLPDGHYFFDSCITAVQPHASHCYLQLQRPETILVQQRRRSRRTAVNKSIKIQLLRQEDGALQSSSGRLYNLSPQGLACQLPRNEAAAMVVGQMWTVCFNLDEPEQWYKLPVQICRIFSASSPGQMIVGMEFQFEPGDPQHELLQHFFTIRQPAQQHNFLGDLR